MTRGFLLRRLATERRTRYGDAAFDPIMMRRRPPYAAGTLALWLVWSCWLSCASPPAGAAPAARDWDQVMEEIIGPGFDDVLVRQSEKDPLEMDFDLIMRTAEEMSDAMALGHGSLEKKNIPEFGAMARRTEIWLREIVDQARAHRGVLVQELVERGEADYCAKCHDAASEAR